MKRLPKTARAALTPTSLHKLPEGKHADGGGLFLWVRGDSRRWYVNAGTKTHSIGGFPEISLSVAREQALKVKGSIALGIDLAPKEKKTHTLGALAESYHKNRVWGNEKHGKQWLATIKAGVPKLYNKNIAEIDANELETALLEVRKRTPETGKRLTQRLGVIWGRAVLLGIVQLNLPRALGDVLRESTPVVKKKNHPAIDWRLAPAFYQWLCRDSYGMSCLALRFTMLTAARTKEALQARWEEIDDNLRTLPEHMMKMRREHLVHLAPETLKVLKLAKAHPFAETNYIFQSPQTGDKPLSQMAMLELIKDRPKDIFKDHFTAHGMRATFKTWARETNAARNEVIEVALAHFENDAYDRSLYLDERKKLLNAWAKYLTS